MNNLKIIALGAFIFALFACDHPFKAGLGPVEDVRPPTVTLESPAAGEYIYGQQLFKGTAEDDYKLESVWIKQVNYTTYINEDGAEVEYPLREYEKVNLEIKVNKGNWEYTIDTTPFPDGDFKVQLQVFDSVGKSAETDPIVFLINNSLPAIAVSAPYVARGTEPGEAGGSHLNYGAVDSLPSTLTFERQMDKSGFLTGTISHDEDIYLSQPDAANNRYPPQIRIWRIEESPVPGQSWGPGVLPAESDLPWENFIINNTLWALDLGSYQFIRDLPADAGCFYGFELRAQTKDGRAHFHYPRDAYSGRDWSANGDFEKENRYVLIYVRNPRELPTITLYGLENILGTDGWNEATKTYNLLTGLPENYTYVDNITVNRNGSFILRIKTTHPEGISSAEVYWERDGQRGRFIWDLANETPPGHTAATWPDANNVALSRPYSEWGYRDPHSLRDGFYENRSFIYTYNHGGANSVPAGAHEQIAGHSKMQRYLGGAAEWESGKRSGTWSTLPRTIADGMWEDMTVLPEGQYLIEVYTKSTYGTALTVPLQCNILLDRSAPRVEIAQIDGVTDINPAGTLVNGVIKPRMNIFDDLQSQNSGLRSATDPYFSVSEQRYMVISADDKSAFDALIAQGNWWPPVPATTADNWTITGTAIVAAKHGPVVDSRFQFKTSNIYYGDDYDETGLVERGLSLSPKNSAISEAGQTLSEGTHYLYVFARDNAFNVGHTSLRLEVDRFSDFPEFDFSKGGSIGLAVTNPNVSADLNGNGENNGFRYYINGVNANGGIGVRNYMGPGTAIEFELKDDDSLDLGSASADSPVEISIAGSTRSGNNITATTPAEKLTDQSIIKTIFNSQPAGNFGGRGAVKSRTGKIDQRVLANLLYPSDGHTSLPDGIYQITITAADYAPAKLIVDGEHLNTEAAVAKKTVSFWIAVDSIAPAISNIEPKSGAYIGSTTATIKGTVTDQNGPITGELLYVKNELGATVVSSRAISVAENGNFEANIPMPPNTTSGIFYFTLQFKDRFDTPGTIELEYRVDEIPPTVALLRSIKTFSRTGTAAPAADSERLTNGFVTFAITAKDNLKVKEVRWWLLPAADAAPSFDSYSIAGVTADTTRSLGTNRKGGRITDDTKFSGHPWYVNTNDLATGRYILYAMAEDEANQRTSSSNILLQTIYVLQEEDKPWFGTANNITPNAGTGQGVIGAEDAVVRGSIYEDDGFFKTDGTVIDGAVKIYMSNSALPANIDTIADTAFTTVTSGVSRAGTSNNINLAIDLKPLFAGILSTDGTKYYVIEARDSWNELRDNSIQGKFTDESGTTATGATELTSKTRRQAFSFVYDSKDPKIEITYPATGTTFGPSSNQTTSPNAFYLEGKITDTYLAALPNGNYYISYRLGTAGDYHDIDLGRGGTATGGYITGNTVTGGDRVVTFRIPADVFTNQIGYTALVSNTYSLSLQVKDQSNKTGNAALSFIKDMTPPVVAFNTINGLQLPPVTGTTNSAWWATVNNTAYLAKRTALGNMTTPLTVLRKDNSNTVTIQGTFTDELSNVAGSFEYALDNSTTWTTLSIPGGGNSRNVNWTISLTNPAEGVHSIRIRVADVGGNLTTTAEQGYYYGFIVVSRQPTVTISTATGLVMGDYKAAGQSVNDDDVVFTIGGTASSYSLGALHDVKLKISYSGGAVWDSGALGGTAGSFTSGLSFTTTPEFLETGNWSYNVTRKALYSAGNVSDEVLKNGTYELSAFAVDKSGTESAEKTWPFTVDSGKPQFAFTTPRNVVAGGPGDAGTDFKPSHWLTNTGTRNVITGTELQASISDKNRLSAAQYQIRKYDYETDKWGSYYNGSTGAAVAEASSWIAVSPAVAGTDHTWTLNIENLTDGYYYVRIRAKDESVLYNNTANAGNWNNTGADAGNGNPGTSDYGYFFLSRSSPALTNVGNDSMFSSRVVSGNTLPFKVNAKDPNWFQSLSVTVTSQVDGTTYDNGATGNITLPTPNYQYSGVAAGWEPEVRIRFLPATCPDGAYKITFTVTNLAGKPASISRTITLDNTPPEGKFELPGLMNVGAYAPGYPAGEKISGPGETIYGGNASDEISGTTEDKSFNGISSGVKEVWYHLGYVGTAANAQHTLAFPTATVVAGTVVGGTDLGGTANNALFDTAAGNNSSAWFKYAPSYPAPVGAAAHGNDVINWKLVISDIARYAKADFTLKTGSATRYNNAGGSWMVKQITNQDGLPNSIKKNGLYSLPLWIRVADTAGNVSYFCRDIWLYPNGDYPSNAFTNPGENTGFGSPRGGQFAVEGVASDNISVKTVIYRVKADAEKSTANAADQWATTPPADARIITIPNGKPVLATDAEFTNIPDYTTTNNNPFTSRYTKTGWYYADLESNTHAPTMSWSFMLNAQEELTNLMIPANDGTWCFLDGSVRYMRVWVEVFVFDGNNGNAATYNKISLNGDDATLPKPDVRVFYMKQSAPRIDTLLLSVKDGNFENKAGNAFVSGDFSAYSQSAATIENLRSRRFAVRMNLNGNGVNLSQIETRITGGSGWQTIWRSTNSPAIPTGITLTNQTAQAATMTYAFDSTVTAAANNYAPVQNGNWRESGGAFTVEVRIRDISAGEAIARFDIGIDNFAPVADTGNVTNSKVAGTNVLFLGRAYDYRQASGAAAEPANRGIQEVYAWFTRHSNGTQDYINMNDGTVGSATTSTRYAWTGRTATITGAGVNDNPTSIAVTAVGTRETVTYPTANNYFKRLSAAAGAVLGTGIIWQPNNNNNADISWSFTTDTTKMPDGWIYLNYLVIDDAGNATQYQQRMMVRNNYPQITSVVLYTDNSGEGAVFTTHDTNQAYTEIALKDNNTYVVSDELYGDKTYYTDKSGYLNSGFISKNRLIGFGIQTANTARNWPLNYRVTYVTRERIQLTNANLRAMASGSNGLVNLYTIDTADQVSPTNWNTLGVKEANPVRGNHFVFQPTLAEVGTTLAYTNGYVWGYRQVFAPPTTNTTAGPAQPVKREDSQVPWTPAANEPENTFSLDVMPNHLYYNGDTYFDLATTSAKIHENRGSQPGKDDWNGQGTYDPDTGGNNPANTAFFIIKVWDSVGEQNRPSGETRYTGENDQLYDAVVVGMNVYLSDTKNPTARLYDLNPYTETAVRGNNIGDANQATTRKNAADPTAIGQNILRGGLYNTGTVQNLKKSGYIEPRNGTTALNAWFNDSNLGWTQFTPNGIVNGDSNVLAAPVANPERDKVSGKIILRGWAWDDQLIDEIRIAITGETTKTILKFLYVDSEGKALQNQTNPPAGSVKKMARPYRDSASTEVWESWAVEDLHWERGHTVEWAYIWDTEGNNTTHSPAANRTVLVTVVDKNGPRTSPTLTADNIANRVFHNSTIVDIVPYVTGFERQSIYNNTRSRQGWYSFYQNETNIAIVGYNLGTTNLALYMGGTPGTVIAPAPSYSAATQRWTFTVPNAAVSGRINVSAGGTAIHNHNSNHAEKSWNRESSSYTSGSELWINKPHAHIWRTQQGATATPYTYFGQENATTVDSAGLSRPSMALEYTGTDSGRLTGVWATYGNADSYYARNNGNKRMDNQNAGNRGLEATRAGNNNIPGEPFLAQDVSFYNGAVANGVVALANEVDGGPVIYVYQGATFTAQTAVTSASTTQPGVSTQRWQNMRVVRADGRFHLSTYDASTRRLQYYNTDRIVADGYSIDGSGAGAGATGSETASNNAGLYSAIDYDNTGPIVAYYDSANDALRIAFAASNTPTTTGNWTRSYVGSANSGYGQYVSIKVDKDGGIHLAFYNSKAKTVGYAYAANRTAGFTIVSEVDKIIEGGTWTDISVDNNGNPVIVYGETARIGNYDGVRMAYKSSSTTGFAFTDPWEALTMPSNYKVKNDRLNIEAWPPTARGTLNATRVNSETWNAAIGYAGDDATGTGNTFRIGYFTYPASKGY